MTIWFKKKTENSIEAPMAQPTESKVKTDSLTDVLPSITPAAPVISAPPRAFKLPPMPDASDIPASQPEPTAMASAVLPPVDSTETAPLPPPLFAQEAVLTDTPAPIGGDVANAVEVKSILKPIALKSKIQVADKTAVIPPKMEPVAADTPNVPRSDPKALYYQLMNGLYDVVFVLDDGGHVIDCNSRAEEIFGYSSDDVWNLPIEKIIYGMNSRMLGLLQKNLANKRHILIDARCFRSNGTSFLAEVGVSTVQLTRSVNVVFAIRNVERRKNSAEELRKYRAVLDILPMPAFTCDLHGAFEVLNPPVLKALGMIDEMEAQKMRFGEMLPDMVSHFQNAVRGEEVDTTKELTRPDGSVYTLELRLKPMRKGDEITGVAGTMIFT